MYAFRHVPYQQAILCNFALLQCVAVCCSFVCANESYLFEKRQNFSQKKRLEGATVGRVSCQNVVLCKLALLQCVAVCCSVLQYVAVRFNVLQRASAVERVLSPDDRLCRHALLQCVAVCCSLLPKNWSGVLLVVYPITRPQFCKCTCVSVCARNHLLLPSLSIQTPMYLLLRVALSRAHDLFICVTWWIHLSGMPPSYVRHVEFIFVAWLMYMCDMTDATWDMTHSYVRHDSCICGTWLIHMCDMTHSYVRHDSFICKTWLIHMWDRTHAYVRHDSFITVIWFIHMWDMTHSYVRHDSFICETWLMHMWEMTHSYVSLRHDSFICVTWFIHMWDMIHSYVRHDSFICETWFIHIWNMTLSYVRHDEFICETWFIHMSDMTHSYVRHDSFICETWLIHMWDMTHSSELHARIKYVVQYVAVCCSVLQCLARACARLFSPSARKTSWNTAGVEPVH